MKRQIRRNVFETNSSSTHSIAISKHPATIRKHISFRIGEYGWKNDCVDTASYLYTAILEQDDATDMLEQLKNILDKYSIEYEFEKCRYITSSDGEYRWLEYGYIDHSNETRELIFELLNNEDLLMRYLFGDSSVYTGNDNQYCEPSGCNIANEYAWDDDGNMYKNPYHDPVNYEYFYKGN